MFRSFVTLMLLAGLNVPSLETAPLSPPVFDSTELLEVGVLPDKAHNAIAPVVEAEAALLMDLDTGLILFEKNAHTPLPMASLTKIMTAILILESHDLDEWVTVETDFTGLEGVRMWLQLYEKITVNDLLYGLLIPSAGDAALALAEYDSGSVAAFVAKMNERARILNLKQTHFKNPVGLDEQGHVSTAFDLALLAKHALRFPAFRSIVNTGAITVSSSNGRIHHELFNTNPLLNSYLDIRGVKTGTTEGAGESVINLARGTRGQEVLTVLLNSPNRFQESKSMIDWAFRNHRW